MHNGFQNLKKIILKSVQPLIYRKERELDFIHKIYGVSKKEQNHPTGFISFRGYNIFLSLLDTYKNKTNLRASFSFVYYALDKDAFINFSNIEFIKYLSETHSIIIDKVDSRHAKPSENARYPHYIQLRDVY